MKKIIILILFFFNLISYAQVNEQKKISVQFMWLDQFEFAGFYVAKEKGYYSKLGLDVNFQKFTVDTNIVDNVLKGKSDFGTSSSSLIIDKSNGKDIKLLGSIFQSSPLVLLALKNSQINTLEDIKNKKIMLTEKQLHFAPLQSMLLSKNIHMEDIKPVKHSFDVNDLINKKVDLMVAYSTNEPYRLKEKGYESKIFHPKDYGFDFYEEFIFTSSTFAKNNPETVRNFYDATIKGWEYAFNNIEEIAQLVYEKYNVQNKSLDSLIYEATEMKKLVYTSNNKIGTITKNKLKLIENSYRIMGLLKNELNLDELIYPINNKLGIGLTKDEKKYLNNKKSLNMCIDPNWMPFEKNENGKHIGMSADYFEIFKKKIGIDIKMIPTSTWSQSLAFGYERKCDIFSLVMSTPKREESFNFTNPYMNIPLVLASNLNANFINNILQVKKEKLGIVKDYAYSELLINKYPNINFIQVNNIKEGLNKVQNGELFGFIGALSTVGYLIQREYIGQLKITGKFDETWHLGVGTRNDEPLLTSIFNKAIDSISYETRQTILNKWIYVNYQKGINFDFIIKFIIGFIIILFLSFLIYRQILLKKLNQQLNEKVKEEVEKNSKQNQILNQQAKMASMGEMLGNIAHQWRQPLSMISLTATSLKFRKEFDEVSDKDLNESLDSINNTAQFLSNTIDDFKNFLVQGGVKTNFDISTTLEKSLGLIGAKFTNQDIKIIIKSENIEISSFENELIQVFINILNNAIDALDRKDDNKYIFIETNLIKDELIITIKDNAGGIDTNIISKIFDPYFTTKHQSQGTGIGLYMSEQIITKRIKGSIRVDNIDYTHEKKKYTGALFTIILNTI